MSSLNRWIHLPLTSHLPASGKKKFLVFFVFLSKLELGYLFFANTRDLTNIFIFPFLLPSQPPFFLDFRSSEMDTRGLSAYSGSTMSLSHNLSKPQFPQKKGVEATSFLSNNDRMNLTLKSFENHTSSLIQKHAGKYIMFRT